MLENMNGKYPINEQLINHISLRLRRKGKISFCYNVTQLQMVKLKMHGNAFVDSYFDLPNSIIINGKQTPSMAEEIKHYKEMVNTVSV